MLRFQFVCQYNIFYCRFLALCYVTVYSGRQVLVVFIFTLKMEAFCPSETLVNTQSCNSLTVTTMTISNTI
jgi:hypothetical protein